MIFTLFLKNTRKTDFQYEYLGAAIFSESVSSCSTLENNSSNFDLGTNGNVTNVSNQLTGRFYYRYTDQSETRYRYIQFSDNNWSMTNYKYSSYGSERNYNASSNPNNTLLLLEKWTRKEVQGGLKGEFNNGDVDFGWADSDSVAATQSITKTFTISAFVKLKTSLPFIIVPIFLLKEFFRTSSIWDASSEFNPESIKMSSSLFSITPMFVCPKRQKVDFES